MIYRLPLEFEKKIAFPYEFRQYFFFKLDTLINILIAKLNFCFIKIVVSISINLFFNWDSLHTRLNS